VTETNHPSEDRVEGIIAAALTTFSEQGFAEARLEDIARRAHVSVSTLVLHFSSKEELFREVVRSTLIDVLGPIERTTLDQRSAADVVRSFAQDYWRTMSRPELAAIVRLVLGELPRFPELAVLHATETLERFLRMLERVIETGIARGELEPTDARASARMIQATLIAHALWFAHPEIYAGVTGSDRERAAEATIDAMIRALSRRKIGVRLQTPGLESDPNLHDP
jgi:AcrR family transcriptional regulator